MPLPRQGGSELHEEPPRVRPQGLQSTNVDWFGGVGVMGPDSGPRVILEVREQPAERGGCGYLDRTRFGRRTLPRLSEEFGDRLVITWQQPGPEACTLPLLLLDGVPVHKGGYLPWEVLRPMVAHALALHAGVDELAREAAAELRRLDLSATDWQEGLLVWLASTIGVTTAGSRTSERSRGCLTPRERT